MRSVSSECSKSRTSVVPCDSADSSRTRLEMLLEPGRRTVPRALCKGGRSINSGWLIGDSVGRCAPVRLLRCPVAAHPARLAEHLLQFVCIAPLQRLEQAIQLIGI